MHTSHAIHRLRHALMALGLPFLLGLPTAATAVDEEILYQQLPGWNIVAHRFSGQFGGCSAWTSHGAGYRLHLGNSGTEWRLATDYGLGNDTAGSISVDGQRWNTRFFNNGEMMVTPLTGAIIDAAAAGQQMTLVLNNVQIVFSMRGSRNAIGAVFDCLRAPW